MTVAIMQPYLFPYIGYFQLINAVDKFIIYDDVAFIKQGWINRNNILLNKQPHLFIVPVQHISSFIKIRETEISYKIDWRPKLIKTLEQAYGKAPYFELVFDWVRELLMKKHSTIDQLTRQTIIECCKYLEIDSEIVNSSSIYQNNELKAKNRVIDICHKEKAKYYINSFGGIDLYNKDEFSRNEIELKFIKTNEIQYNQFNNKFVSNLSIIDVMMFNKVPIIKEYLKQYELV